MKNCEIGEKMDAKSGKKTWIFPDAELPPPGDEAVKAHESLIVLNQTNQSADLKITLFFADKNPVFLEGICVAGRRVRCLRLDNADDLMGYKIAPGEQYALRLDSSVEVIAQYGRLDTRKNMAFYTVMGYCC